MHSMTTKSGTIIHHNGDYDGNVLITRPGDDPYEQFEVPFSCLAELVAQCVNMKRIGRLEDMTADEILGIELYYPKKEQL